MSMEFFNRIKSLEAEFLKLLSRVEVLEEKLAQNHAQVVQQPPQTVESHPKVASDLVAWAMSQPLKARNAKKSI